jgi:hypothetical protein
VGAFALAAAAVLGGTLLLVQWMSPLAAAVRLGGGRRVILAAVGAGLLKSGGERLRPGRLLPRRSLESIKEDARWARRQV